MVVFEQYLRVAMLQQEHAAIELNQMLDIRKLNSNSSNEIKIVNEFQFESGTAILDPTLAFTIAQYDKDLPRKFMKNSRSVPALPDSVS